MIVDVHGNLPRIELFARQKTPNWDIWGNELENCFDYGKKEAPCSQNLTNMPTTDLDTKASV
jgi:N6-adenosine-specific RNA methylase IME4